MKHLSYSQLAEWRRCRQKYSWHYQDGVRSREVPLGLRRGSAGHHGVGHWYLTGNIEEAVVEARKSWDVQSGTEDEKNWDILELILRRYFEWAGWNDPWTEILATEWKFEIPIAATGQVFIGFIDLIAKAGDELWIVDHKFVKQANHAHLGLDAQMTTYLAAMLQSEWGLPMGAMYNSILAVPGGKAELEPVKRSLVHRTEHSAQLAWKEIERQAYEVQRYWVSSHEERELLVYRTPTRDCHWDCEFYAACLAMEHDGSHEQVLFNDALYGRKSSFEFVLGQESDGEGGS